MGANGEAVREVDRRFAAQVKELRTWAESAMQQQVEAMQEQVQQVRIALEANEAELSVKLEENAAKQNTDLKVFRARYDAKIIKVNEDMGWFKKHLDFVDLDRLPKVKKKDAEKLKNSASDKKLGPVEPESGGGSSSG